MPLSLFPPPPDLKTGLYGAIVTPKGDTLELQLAVKYGDFDTPIKEGMVLVFVSERDLYGEIKGEVKESKYLGIEEGETFSRKE